MEIKTDTTVLDPEDIADVTGGVYIGPCTTYVVVKGDNLTKIAKRNHTDVDTLVKLNRIRNRDRIYIGQVLLIPIPMVLR